MCICMRVYPGVTRTPIIGGSKLETYSLCLNSLLTACKQHNVYFIFLLDSCPKEYEDLINSLTEKFNIKNKIVRCNHKDGKQTFLLQLNYLTSSQADIVGFVEDDYYFDNAAIDSIYEMYSYYPKDYYTLFNSSDYNQLDLHNYIKKKHNLRTINCIEVASTTLTFFTSRQNLKLHYNNFCSYRFYNNDYLIWLSITKKYKPFLYSFIYTKLTFIKVKKLSKFIFFSYLYFSSKRKLFVIIPGQSVHFDPCGFSDDHIVIDNKIRALGS